MLLLFENLFDFRKEKHKNKINNNELKTTNIFDNTKEEPNNIKTNDAFKFCDLFDLEK